MVSEVSPELPHTYYPTVLQTYLCANIYPLNLKLKTGLLLLHVDACAVDSFSSLGSWAEPEKATVPLPTKQPLIFTPIHFLPMSLHGKVGKHCTKLYTL